MKIAVSAKSEGLKAKIDDRFGRCEYFVIVDTDTMEVKSLENESKNEGSGVGGMAVRTLANEGVKAIIAPEIGPKAATAIKAFEMTVYKKAHYKTVGNAITAYKSGALEEFEVFDPEETSGLKRV